MYSLSVIIAHEALGVLNMIKFWINLVLIVLIVAVGLAIGAANDSSVFFDFLVVKADVSLATVLVVGVVFGFVLGLLGSILLILKTWNQARIARSNLAKLNKEVAKLSSELEEANKEKSTLIEKA